MNIKFNIYIYIYILYIYNVCMYINIYIYIYIYIYIQTLFWLASPSRRSISSEICLKVFVVVFVILERSPSTTVSSAKRYAYLDFLLFIHDHGSVLQSFSSSISFVPLTATRCHGFRIHDQPIFPIFERFHDGLSAVLDRGLTITSFTHG